MNQQIFIDRARIIDGIREWFNSENFLEVETPILVRHPDLAPDLDLFSTEFVSKDGKYRERRYLHTSPEYAMKKLLGAVARGTVRSVTAAGGEAKDSEIEKSKILSVEESASPFQEGFGNIFQICKTFRNAEWVDGQTEANRHNPEFTMLEWYRLGADYLGIMSDTENMIKYVDQQMGTTSQFQGEWERLSVREAFKKYADLDLDQLRTVELLRAAVEQKGYEFGTSYTWDDLFFLIMLNEIEPKLGFERPVFIYDYPASQAALAKKRSDDPFWAERFELYINGVELCNAFSELNDPVEQRQRFEAERAIRLAMGKEDIGLDEELLKAQETMPACGGNAVGIDRLIMVLLGKKSIEEVLLFPW
jgi:lysyl-tRNA synthetase class 2